MKGFKKLALVSAIAAMPMSGFAMEALDDATLSGVTGQDGISIDLGTQITSDIIIHDKDGYTSDINYANAGAIILNGFGLTYTGTIGIDIDAGASVADEAVLNIGITTPASMTVALGNLEVASSNKVGTADSTNWGTVAASNVVIANLGSLTLGTTTMNIQLGSEPQGNMISMASTITGGITLSDFALLDAGGAINGGGIRMGSLQLVDTGGTNLTVDADVDVNAGALVITVNQLGNSSDQADLRIHNLRLGNATAATLGDIELSGLDLSGTISISGK